MSGERGLASSRWASINTGRPPYYWSSSRSRTQTTTAFSTSTSTYLASNTGTYASPSPSPRLSTGISPPPFKNETAAATPAPAYSLPTNGNYPPSSGAPYHLDASALGRIPTPWAELARFMKIARRMRWKLPFLAYGYRAATESANDERDEAELMFKLDFFEYYMLLERALVHLMGVFGVKVTGALGGGAHRRTAGYQHQHSDHRFHANVLEALDDPRNPLHAVLGRDDTRYALARAKELRNRWKNADDPDATAAARAASSSSSRLQQQQASRPLGDYDLARIMETIFSGLEAAHGVAEQYVADVRALGAVGGDVGMSSDPAAADDEAAQWEFMVDAMDWEAV